jgi:phosphate starvation-inducible protein PhoH
MTETRTLEFESARALQSLYANDIKLLKNLEDSLGVRVTTREGWVKIEGEPDKLDRVQRVFDQLEEARKRGVDIQKHEFNYALNSVSEERADDLSDAITLGSLLRRARRRSSHARLDKKITSRQLRNTMSSLPSGRRVPAKLIWRWRWR